MSKVIKKLMPLKLENAIYYRYPTELLTPEIKNYVKSFNMEREIFTKNRNLKGRKEKICEIRKIGYFTLFPRFLGEAISALYDVPIKKYKFEYKFIENNLSHDFNTEPRPGQNEVFVGLMDILRSVSGATLQLNTGQGKTWVVSKVIWKFWQNTIIFVQNKELQHQMCTEIEQHTGITWICKIGGDAKTKDRKQLDTFLESGQELPFIGVAVYKSANNLYQKYGSTIWDKFYLSIYDECHCYCNPTGIPLLKYCQTPVKFALSATPADGWNTKLIQLWCGMLYNGDEIMPKKNIHGHVKIIKYYGSKNYSESQKDSHGVNNFIDTLRLIEQDDFRRNMGMEEVWALYEKDLYPLVFFQHVDYMKLVKHDFEQKYNTQVGALFGETPKNEREEIKKSAKIIFTTYKFGYVGLNIPNVKSMVLFEPHKSLGKQVNGRTMRDMSETTRLYVDIVDMVSFLGRQLGSRMEDYTARGFSIDQVVVKVPNKEKN